MCRAYRDIPEFIIINEMPIVPEVYPETQLNYDNIDLSFFTVMSILIILVLYLFFVS